jgi:hypothetical protein
MKALDIVLATAPARYVDNYVTLARIIRVEADVKHTMATPKTVEEALAELESKVGGERPPQVREVPALNGRRA